MSYRFFSPATTSMGIGLYLNLADPRGSRGVDNLSATSPNKRCGGYE